MNSIIKNIIPLSRYEIIRDRIGEMLFVEFANQKSLTNDDTLDVDVYVEAFTAFFDSDKTPINITFAGGPYDNKETNKVDGNYTYNIDFYATAESDGVAGGDKLATIKLHRIMAVARAILEYPNYRTLGFDPPFNCNTHVASIAISDPINRQDATHQIQGRLEFSVRVPEPNTLIQPALIGTHGTMVKLDLTDKGYRYTWSTLTQVPIGSVTSTFTLPLAYTGMIADVVSDGNQSYTSGFTQTGDTITMTNGVTFLPGTNVTVSLKLHDYTATITIAADGNSFTLPDTYDGKTIQIVDDGSQSYTSSSFNQSGLTISMTNAVTFVAGQQVKIWYGIQLVPVTVAAGNQFILPTQYRNFDQVLVFDGNQSYSSGYNQPEVITTMTNGVTFIDGQQLIIALR